MAGRYLWMASVALAFILPTIWLLPVMQMSRRGLPQAEEIRYVKVLDGSTGKRFTVRNTEQIRMILGCLPGKAGMGKSMSGNGFLLEFVYRGGRGVMRYALDASLSLRHMKNRRYCEEYLRHLEI
ncbi:MAG TPA: hypothetical protein DF613_06430 [Lachnospiraceae bacterium]|nr:hypothetical protein [Lachnospiraceae bacterium]